MSSSFNDALATPQYTTVRSGRYAGDRLLYLFKNTVVFAGQINSDLTTPQTWASFLYNNVTVGAYTDVREGMVLYIGTTNDLFAAAKSGFYGRTRLVPDATTFYCNESSEDFDVGDYFWVVSRYDIQYKLSRPTPLTNVELVDYDIPYQGLLPRVVGLQTGYMAYVNPSTGKLRLGFDVSDSEAAESGETIASYAYAFPSATLVAGALDEAICIMDFDPGEQYGACDVIDTGGLDLNRRFGIVALDDTLYPPDTGYTNGSLGGTLDQGYTLIIPAFKDVDSVLYNSFAIAIRANEQYGGTVQTLYGGGSAAVTNKVLTSQTATLTAAGHNYQAGQKVIVADVGTQFDGSFVITATTSTTFSYHSAQANVGSTGCAGMSVVNPPKPDFAGWLNRESDPLAGDPLYSTKTGAEFVFTGVAPRLARLTAQLLAMVLSASGTRWGDIAALTPWRAVWHFLSRYTTAAVVCDVTFSDTTDQFQFPDISTEGQDALGAIRWIGAMINAIPEFAPWGAIAVNRDVNYLSQAERNLTTVVANFTAADFLEAPRSIDPNQSVGKVDTDAAVYNTANSQVTVFTARAPGHAQGEASGSETLPGQALAASPDMVAALDEARQRVAQKFEIANLQETLDVRFKAGWVGIYLISSRSQVYTVTLSEVGGPNGVNRVEYDTDTLWTLESITIEYDAEHGRLMPHGKLRRVADIGGPGDNTTQNIPAPNSVPDPQPDLGFPAFNFELPDLTLPESGVELSQVNPIALLPPKGKIAGFKGGEVLTWSTSRIYYLKSFIVLKKPVATEITPSNLPSGYTIVQCVVDPAFTNTAIPAYVLITNNTDSQVGWCSNIAAPGASELWTFGTAFSGAYSVIRAAGAAGAILIASPTETGTWSKTFNFVDDGDGGFTVYSTAPNAYNIGTYSAGVGWIQTTGTRGDGSFSRGVEIVKTFTTGTVKSVSMTYNLTKGVNDSVTDTQFISIVYTSKVYSQVASGSNLTIAGSGSSSIGSIQIQLLSDHSDSTSAGFTGSCTIKSITLNGTGADPFSGPGVGQVNVRYSSDYGATVGSAMPVSDSPGSVAGFDCQRAGSVSYVGTKNAVYKSSVLGGGYSLFKTFASGEPTCVIIPYYTWSGAINTSNASPDVIVGLDASDGTGTLKWIEGDGTTHDITPVASFLFGNVNAVTVSFQHHLAVFGTVSGTAKLYTTTNRASSWTNRGTITSPQFIRVRRNDNTAAVSGANNGQLYLVQGSTAVIDYSATWAAGGGTDAGLWPHTMPVGDLIGVDPIY